jgi:hypothetical protein
VSHRAGGLHGIVARRRRGHAQLLGQGREGEVVAVLTAEFERENPGIRVRVQQMPWTTTTRRC